MQTRRLVLGLAALASAVLLVYVLSADEPAKGRKFALLVGVKNYNGGALRKLDYTENDVTDLAEVLRTHGGFGGPDDQVLLMTDTEAFQKKQKNLFPTAENIRQQLKGLVEDLRPEDTVLVALTGHGVGLKKGGQMYFCPSDADLSDPKTLVSLSEVYEKLEKDCKAGVKLLFVDACRNDPFEDASKAARVDLDSVTRPRLPDPPGGVAAFFSCSAGERSFDSPELHHGFFSHYLIEGLKGKAAGEDGEVTVPLLEDYLTREVPVAVKKEQKDPQAHQVPERKGALRGRVVLARTDPGSKPPDATTTEADDKTEEFEYKIEGETKKGKRRVLTLDLGGGVKMEFVRIKAGNFQMGSPESDTGALSAERPQHEVEITKDFYLGKYLVTKKQFARFVAAKGGYKTEAEADGKGGYGYGPFDIYPKQDPKFTWRDPGFDQSDAHPVVEVTWNDAAEFCKWASEATKRRVVLPREAEWEYACRGGTATRYFTGEADESLEKSANLADASLKARRPTTTWAASWDDKYAYTSPVGEFRPNPLGLYDMVGNAQEWCADYYDGNPYGNEDKKDPENTDKADCRVLRGGDWGGGPASCRPAVRGGHAPADRSSDVGFRVAFRLD